MVAKQQTTDWDHFNQQSRLILAVIWGILDHHFGTKLNILNTQDSFQLCWFRLKLIFCLSCQESFKLFMVGKVSRQKVLFFCFFFLYIMDSCVTAWTGKWDSVIDEMESFCIVSGLRRFYRDAFILTTAPQKRKEKKKKNLIPKNLQKKGGAGSKTQP